jgi:putative YhdH/YhfP family quinone oxidoreductase
VSNQTFQAFVVAEQADGTFTHTIEAHPLANLPPGEVLIKVAYSSLNYKDALSATGNKGVTRHYPHTPGIDAAGVVVAADSNTFQPGDQVLVTGYDLGMNTAGGFGGFIRVPAAWVIPLPDGLTLAEAMAYGTAGLTAAICLLRLEDQGLTPDQGEVLVTGATGGVGSIAVSLLAKMGYTVVAATGKTEQRDFLTALGATTVIHRDEVNDETSRLLLKERWAGVVDTVGGNMLATALKSTQYGHSVACCGLAASAELPIAVYPFILRGVNLLGVDSVNIDMPTRLKLWQRLANAWKLPHLDTIAQERTLTGLYPEIERILAGQQVGRIVVKLPA